MGIRYTLGHIKERKQRPASAFITGPSELQTREQSVSYQATLHPQHRPAVIKPQQSQTKLSDRYVSNLVGLSGSAAVKFSDLGAGNLPVWKKTVRN